MNFTDHLSTIYIFSYNIISKMPGKLGISNTGSIKKWWPSPGYDAFTQFTVINLSFSMNLPTCILLLNNFSLVFWLRILLPKGLISRRY